MPRARRLAPRRRRLRRLRRPDRARTAALAGIELADSITLDPHKWLYQPFECGCLLVRDGKALRRAFEIAPTTSATRRPRGEVNFADLGLQLTRTTRAFKLWFSLRTFGLDAFRASIDRCLDLAELAGTRIEASEPLELAAPVSLGVVCFRRRPHADEDDEWLTDGLVAALEHSGVGFISSTRVHGLPALRLCILNHTSTANDVEQVIAFLESAEPVAAPAGYDPHADVGDSVPVFARLEAAEAELLATLSTELRAAGGRHDRRALGDEPRLLRARGGSRRRRHRRGGRLDSPCRRVLRRDRSARMGSRLRAFEDRDGDRTASVRLRVLEPDALARLLEAFPRLEREIRRRAYDRLRQLG